MQIGDIVKLQVPKDHIGTVIAVDEDNVHYVEYWGPYEPGSTLPFRWITSCAEDYLERLDPEDAK